MTTDPKKVRDDADQRLPSGAESKDGAHGASGGERSKAGSDYGDWVPDRGQPRRNDDRDADPATGGDLMNVARQPGSPQAESDKQHAGTKRTGVPGEQERIEAEEAETRAESNRNKDFDTTHVHSSTTSRKV
jgi:hypothetical protein